MTTSAYGVSPSGQPPLLAADGLTVRRTGDGALVLPPTGLRAAPGQVLVITGPSGAGKTTLLNALLDTLPAGLRRSAGTVHWQGTLLKAGRSARKWRRTRCGRLGQDPGATLHPLWRVGHLIGEDLAGDRGTRAARVAEQLDLLGLPPELVSRRAGQLSGGQAQRVALARALAADPDLLVLDEPTSAMDAATAALVKRAVEARRGSPDRCVVLVTHDERLFGELADVTIRVTPAEAPAGPGPLRPMSSASARATGDGRASAPPRPTASRTLLETDQTDRTGLDVSGTSLEADRSGPGVSCAPAGGDRPESGVSGALLDADRSGSGVPRALLDVDRSGPGVSCAPAGGDRPEPGVSRALLDGDRPGSGVSGALLDAGLPGPRVLPGQLDADLADHLAAPSPPLGVGLGGEAPRPARAPSGAESRENVERQSAPQSATAPRRLITLSARRLGLTTPDGTVLLEDCDLDLPAGSATAVVGVSGVGKTTLLHALVGRRPAAAGALLLHGEPLPAATRHRNRDQLRAVQLVGQSAVDELNPAQRVGRAVARPLSVLHGLDRATALAQAQAVLAAVGLPPGVAACRPHLLSGGQRQRVVLARALAARPDVLLLDEPTASLDPGTARSVLDLLDRIRTTGTAILTVTHDPAVAARADDVLTLRNGRLTEDSAHLSATPAKPRTDRTEPPVVRRSDR